MTLPIYQVKSDFFKTLGHPARVRILEVLKDGEHSVSEMIPKIGIEASHLSHQLAILRKANIVQTRKVAATVYYSVVDAKIFDLLDISKDILTSSLQGFSELLAELGRLDSNISN
jgi:ArsR family transcriptional regulator